jgi:hypothetical protein
LISQRPGATGYDVKRGIAASAYGLVGRLRDNVWRHGHKRPLKFVRPDVNRGICNARIAIEIRTGWSIRIIAGVDAGRV